MAVESANNRINRIMERALFALIAVAVSVSTTMQWQSHKDTVELREVVNQVVGITSLHDARIASNEAAIAEMKGKMLTRDILKRIELFLAGDSKGDADSATLKAIRAEREAWGGE